MLDIKFIIENREAVEKSIAMRHVTADLDAVIAAYDRFRETKQALEEKQAEANQVAKTISKADPAERPALIERGSALKAETSTLGEKLAGYEAEFQELMLTVPNTLPDDTPEGKDDQANIEISKFMEPPRVNFKQKDHIELGKSLDLIDFEGGAKVAGAKFYFLKNEAVLLEMALQHFAFKKAIERGFIPLQTPDLARNDVLQGAGFAPRGNESNTYRIEDQDLSLVATAEIPVGGLHANEILPEEALPLRYVAWSHCFRTEAGAAGQASKGLYRVHQFSKVELYAFTTPEQSAAVHEEMLELEESIYQDLKIPYRVVRICAGDLGAPAWKKYDIEAWMPGKGENGEYGEITSASNCTDFQARRLNVRYKDKASGKNRFVHTLNGTAIAMSRTPIAILENYQTDRGTVIVPEVLRPVMGIDEIFPKNGAVADATQKAAG
ncbi:MAG: serine--tRNA ligase [Micavibrio sp.]|nr:MAG: serine--tRNA ligase [Micavibrio sp.]